MESDDLVKRFHSLMSFALESSNLKTPIIAMSWKRSNETKVSETKPGYSVSIVVKSNEIPRKLLFAVSEGEVGDTDSPEQPVLMETIKINFSIFTKPIHVRKIVELIDQQLQRQGGIALTFGIEKMGMEVITAPLATCSEQESRPCVYSDGEISSCQSSSEALNLQMFRDDEQHMKCMKQMERKLSRDSGKF